MSLHYLCLSNLNYLVNLFSLRSKAVTVADGAVSFFCVHHVSTRMSKFMYGVEFLRELDANNPDHVRRKETLLELPSGPKLLPDAFDCILTKVTPHLSISNFWRLLIFFNNRV